MQDEYFEWNDEKAERNYRKHNVTFVTARDVFDDSNAIDEQDESENYGEERYQAIGRAGGHFLLAVIYTIRNGRIRIISARRATPRERLRYRESQA
ncbi:MAG TPA: BrnT family toxin [Rhizomicrobium sp.]|jgi:hypothetical protein